MYVFPKMPLPKRHLDSRLECTVLWVHASLAPNGISFASTVFVGFTVVTNTQTTPRTTPLCGNRPHLYCACHAVYKCAHSRVDPVATPLQFGYTSNYYHIYSPRNAVAAINKQKQ